MAHTLSYLRQEFWIPQGRRLVRDVVMKCYNCRRYQSGPYKMPEMLTWPLKKITQAPPFNFTGLDYIGPIHIKEKEEREKVWICLFTCVVVRAIHLEVVKNMSSESFLLALRRFIARRGKPELIILDNASQFKTASKAVTAIWKGAVNDVEVYNYCSSNQIEWKFITEFSPWEGGFYERLVGMVKSSLRKCIGRITLSEEQLITFITETEAVLNSRPLVYVNADINSKNAITPGHFINIIPSTGIPDVKKSALDEKKLSTKATNLLEIWKKGQQHLNTMWKIWKTDYLTNLRERYQKNLKTPRVQSNYKPQKDQIVHIKDNGPRGTWKIGKIVKLNMGRDNEIRSAKILLPSRVLITRPLNLVYPLETAGVRNVVEHEP